MENSEILIFNIFSVLEGKNISTKKGMPRLSHGFKFGLNKNGCMLKKTKEFNFSVISTLFLRPTYIPFAVLNVFLGRSLKIHFKKHKPLGSEDRSNWKKVSDFVDVTLAPEDYQGVSCTQSRVEYNGTLRGRRWKCSNQQSAGNNPLPLAADAQAWPREPDCG